MIIKAVVTTDQYAQLAALQASDENKIRPSAPKRTVNQIRVISSGKTPGTGRPPSDDIFVYFLWILESRTITSSITGPEKLATLVEMDVANEYVEHEDHQTHVLKKVPDALYRKFWAILQ